VQVWNWNEDTGEETGFSGAIAIKATRDGIEEVGRITHGQDDLDEGYWWGPGIERSLIVGDNLYTYSYDGILQSDLDTVEPGTFVSFWQ
jgi:hypothetical protein